MAAPYESNLGWCPKCNANTGFREEIAIRVWPTYAFKPKGPSVMGGGGSIAARTDDWPDCKVVVVLTCQICHECVTVLQERTGGVFYGDVASAKVVVPETAALPVSTDLPPRVKSLFEEALLCDSHGLMRAAAGMYRATIEAVLDELKVAPGKLYNRIRELAKRPEIDDDLTERLHEARVLGNYSLHDGLEFSVEEVADVAELVNEALHLLFVQPAQRHRMRAARRAREKEQA